MVQCAALASGPCPVDVPSFTTTTSTTVVPSPARTRTHQSALIPNATLTPTLRRTPSSVMPPVVRVRLLLVLVPLTPDEYPFLVALLGLLGETLDWRWPQSELAPVRGPTALRRYGSVPGGPRISISCSAATSVRLAGSSS